MILIKIILESLLDSYNKGKCKELSEKEENELLETLIKFKDKFEYKQDETLSTEEASIYLHITRQTLHNYVKQGKLHPKKQLGGTLQFYKRELDNLIKQ